MRPEITMIFDQRLRRSERLTRSNDFRRIYEQACTVSDRFFRVYGAPNHLERSRLGLSVSRRIGKAVVRQRIRRRIREAFRRNRAALSRKWDVIVVARSRSTDPDCDVEESLCRLLVQLNQKRAAPKE